MEKIKFNSQMVVCIGSSDWHLSCHDWFDKKGNIIEDLQEVRRLLNKNNLISLQTIEDNIIIEDYMVCIPSGTYDIDLLYEDDGYWTIMFDDLSITIFANTDDCDYEILK